jgi:tetratricopeptide (TPR) repeat protein
LAQDTTPEKLIEAGHWKRARALVERRLQEAPDDPNATFLLSQIRAAFGDRTSPPVLAEKAVQLDGKVACYHRQLAECQGLLAQHANIFQQIGLARRFRKELDTALELDPKDVQAQRDLLEFYLVAPGIAGGDVKKAEAVAQQIAGIDSCQGYLAKARIAEFRKDSKEAEAHLRRGAEACPSSYKVQMGLAEFLATGRRDEKTAEAVAKASIAMERGRVQAYAILAAIYAGRADQDSLDALLSSAAEAVPDDATPYYRAAERLLSDGRNPAQAERYLRTYLSQEPEGNQPTAADAHWKLGLALRAQGQDSDAVREFRTAVQLDPESPAGRELKRTRPIGNTSNTTRSGGEN